MLADAKTVMNRVWTDPAFARVVLYWYLALLAVLGALTVWFFPSYAYPFGDENQYYSQAQHPWTLIPDIFEGYPVKEITDLYAKRLFLWPFAAVFAIFGFSLLGARLVVLFWALLLAYFTFRIVEQISGHRQALLGVVVMSFTPMFLYLSHGVRPEGLFTLFLVIALWLVIRAAHITWKTYAVVAFVASCTLWIHYNGVLMPPLFFIVLLAYDRGRSWKKVGGFILGGVVFLALFVPISVLPATEFLQRYGLSPETHESSKQIPVLETLDWARVLFDSYSYYLRQLVDSAFGGWSHALIIGIFVLSLVGLMAPQADRRWRLLKIYFLAMLVVLFFVVPNRRLEYLFYLYPVMIPLAIAGLRNARVPAGRVLGVFAGLCLLYGVFAYQLMSVHWNRHQASQEIAAQLSKVIAEYGKPESVRIVGPQQANILAMGTQYRTLHAIIQTRSFLKAILRLHPHIVLLNNAMAGFVLRVGGQDQASIPQTRARMAQTLRSLGFREQKIVMDGAYWMSIFRAPRKRPDPESRNGAP